MQSNTAALSRFFADRRERNESLVLATIVHTVGSTYRKAGAHMLISADGDAAGLLSGGCLEGDLIERARAVIATGTPAVVTYDTRTSDDLIWGIGLGCEGAMQILLTKLDATTGYQPFEFIDRTRRAHGRGAYALVVEGSDRWPPGRAFKVADDSSTLVTFDGERVARLPDESLNESQTRLLRHPAADIGAREVMFESAKLLVIPVVPAIRLLILGAGPDVQPLVAITSHLGWHVTVSDHRPAYAVPDRFPGAAAVLNYLATDIGKHLKLNNFDAAVVMSHHLISDQHYLAALAESQVPYVGLLGPAPRRVRLLADIGDRAKQLAGRLRGPVGLDLGANTPETIALAIASEIQAVLAGRSGRPFTDVAGT